MIVLQFAVVLEKQWLSQEALDDLLRPEHMTYRRLATA
jgi:hypothetical protein